MSPAKGRKIGTKNPSAGRDGTKNSLTPVRHDPPREISNNEDKLWRIVDDYLTGGPAVQERYSMGAWDRASLEDTLNWDMISVNQNENKRLAELRSWAASIAMLRLMEKHAQHDDEALIELLKFDIRYFAAPAVVDRLLYAKLYSVQPPKRDSGAQAANRRFLVTVSEIVKATPKGPATSAVDYRRRYKYLVAHIKELLRVQLSPLLKQRKLDTRLEALLKFIEEQSHIPLRMRNRDFPGWYFDIIEMYTIVKDTPRLEREFIPNLLNRNASRLAKLVLMAEGNLSEDGLKDRMRRSADTPRRHLDETFGFRNWDLVQKWFRKHYGDADPIALLDQGQAK